MSEQKKQTKIVDTTTGEVVFDKEEEMDFQLFTAKGYLLHNNRSEGVKVMHRFEWPISSLDKGKWMDLLPHINKNNALMRKDRPNHPLTVKLICPIIGLSPNKAYLWMKRMKDAHIIRKEDDFFYVNPLYMMAAGRLDPELYRIFEDQLNPVIPEWVQEKYRELRRVE